MPGERALAAEEEIMTTADITPLDRLYAIADEAGFDVSDSTEEDWPEYMAATAATDEIILAPGLDDDETRTDLLAMCIALSYMMAPRGGAPDDPDQYVRAPDGFAVVLRERIPEPPVGPGHRAGQIARAVGRDTGSAAFRFCVTADELAAYEEETGDEASGAEAPAEYLPASGNVS
jgi:hypothetical protein